jgi:hypothetical protein
MEITSVKSEEQDEIEKILDTINKSNAVSNGKLDEYIPELTKFSENELERKKVDIESKMAAVSSTTAIFGAFTPFLVIIVLRILMPQDFEFVLPIVVVLLFFLYYGTIGKDDVKNRNQLYALKVALIGK